MGTFCVTVEIGDLSGANYREMSALVDMGAVTLEEFWLGVDPIAQRLIPVPGLLMSSPHAL